MTDYHLPLSQVNCSKCTNKIQAALTDIFDVSVTHITTQYIDVTTEASLDKIFKIVQDLGYGIGFDFTLPLSGLSCEKCVAKVKQRFAEENRMLYCEITKTQAHLKGALTKEEAIVIIETLGYQVPTETTVTLPLAGLSCGKCVAKVEAALDENPQITAHSVSKTEMTVTSALSQEALIGIIEALGYQVPTETTVTLPLAGLSCGKCVAKVEAALDENPQITARSVSKTEMTVTSSLSQEALISIIEALGYQVPTETTVTLPLAGLSCGKCVAKVEAALDENPQITAHSVSKTEMTVTSSLSQEALIGIIEALGYQVPTETAPSPKIETLPETKTEEKTVINDTQDDVKQYLLSGMSCASCVASVEKAIRQVKGVETVNVNLAERTALIKGSANSDVIIKAIVDAGYGAELSENEQERREKQQAQQQNTYRTFIRDAILALCLGVPLMIWDIAGGSTQIETASEQIGWGIIGLITLLLLATVGRHFYVNAWKAFKHHRASMDTLVALGTGAAWLFSMLVVIIPDAFPLQARHVYFEASSMIIGLITLGHAMEAKARARTSQALERLIDLQPQTAILVTESEEKEVPLEDVQVGDTLRLHPGAKVPVDGEILSGSTYIDEAMLTGEPLASHKQVGDTLHAGTINQQGSVLFQAKHIGADTMLSRIIQLVRQAQSSKPALARLADTIASYFVPAVMIIAIITAMIWYYVGPQPHVMYMLISAVTVLIIACPCALGLATPMAVTVGIGRAAEYGILIRNAEAMQIAANVDTVVIDKTGTLTEGKPKLTRPICYPPFDNAKIISLAASLEQGSEHPLAKAILEAAEIQKSILLKPTDFNAPSGLGLSGNVGEDRVILGNARWMTQNHVDIELANQDVHDMATEGATPIYVAINGELAGILGISDPLREDSIAAVQRLKDQGKTVVMLTGDIELTANAIAKQANIDQVVAGVLPDGKAEEIVRLQKQGKVVAMVGDGINDAPALAHANVGIAMGSGSDVAIESAQFTLMRHSLHSVSDALALSSATLKNIKQNLFFAFIYNVIGIPVAAGILFPITGHLLSPMIAGAAMALSSITVVTNANRLRLFKPQQGEQSL